MVSMKRAILLEEWKLAMLLYSAFVAAVASRFCPPGYRPIGEGCYFYGHFRLNWFRAMEFCHSFGKVGSRPVSGV